MAADSADSEGARHHSQIRARLGYPSPHRRAALHELEKALWCHDGRHAGPMHWLLDRSTRPSTPKLHHRMGTTVRAPRQHGCSTHGRLRQEKRTPGRPGGSAWRPAAPQVP
jgi:hypothetical protein